MYMRNGPLDALDEIQSNGYSRKMMAKFLSVKGYLLEKTGWTEDPCLELKSQVGDVGEVRQVSNSIRLPD
jgi:hypothetical protein